MARLQKKKNFDQKKKQTHSDESSDSNDLNGGSNSADKAVVAPVVKKTKIEKSTGDIVKGELNFFQKSMEFFREVKVELKKVTWPTRKQTTGTTIVVIVFVFVVAAFLGLFDYALSKRVQVVLT